MRINKFLAQSGLGSRRKVEELIKSGLIFVNDEQCRDLSTQISTGSDVVRFRNKILKLEDEKIYLMLNKPKGYLVTQYDEHGRRTIYDLLPRQYKNLNYIGRLDYNSQGLLILTNDGELNQEIAKPKNKIPKKYEVIINSNLTQENIQQLQTGVMIDGAKTMPAKISNVKDNRFTITIYEGKKRQIRLMIQSLGSEVLELKRIRIGALELGDLETGRYKLLDEKQIKLLTKIA